MTEQINRIVMYLRKSRADAEAEARGEGETLTRHRNELERVAKAQKLTIHTIYQEIVSGDTIADRPVMQCLLREVEQGLWDGVLVMEVERLARGDTRDQGLVAQAFKYSDTKIITPNKIYDPTNEFDEEYFEFSLFMSRREYKVINRRLQHGRLASVNEGKYVGSVAPFGYRRVKLEKEKGFTLIPDETECGTVKMIFDWYANGLNGEQAGACKICCQLNLMKVPTRKGGAWSEPTVLQILHNPVYTGKVKWNSRKSVKTVVEGEIARSRPRAKLEDLLLVDGLHPAIISDELFRRVQSLLGNRPVYPGNVDRPLQNPLAGILYCADCGRRMTRRPVSDAAPMVICTNKDCVNVGASLELVEKRVIEQLALAFGDWRLDWVPVADCSQIQSASQPMVEALERERLRISTQLEKQYDLLEDGTYTKELFTARSAKLTDRANSLDRQLDALRKQAEQTEESRPQSKTPTAGTLAKAYLDCSDFRSKNELLKAVINRIYYHKETRCARNENPGSFDLFILLRELPHAGD